LNAQLKSHGVRFAPDISTASRATVGGMISNNSCGARSVMYGKTIDHVLELDVILSDGSQAHLRPLSRAELEAACQGDTLEARCYRTVRQVAHECAEEIAKRYPKVVRRVAGYNLDEFVDGSKPFNLAKIIVGSEGTLAVLTVAAGMAAAGAGSALASPVTDGALPGGAATPAAQVTASEVSTGLGTQQTAATAGSATASEISTGVVAATPATPSEVSTGITAKPTATPVSADDPSWSPGTTAGVALAGTILALTAVGFAMRSRRGPTVAT